jgi:hypothetical protein
LRLATQNATPPRPRQAKQSAAAVAAHAQLEEWARAQLARLAASPAEPQMKSETTAATAVGHQQAPSSGGAGAGGASGGGGGAGGVVPAPPPPPPPPCLGVRGVLCPVLPEPSALRRWDRPSQDAYWRQRVVRSCRWVPKLPCRLTEISPYLWGACSCGEIETQRPGPGLVEEAEPQGVHRGLRPSRDLGRW